jgi:glycosyltransferase involved in cell wall biosynthesis
VTAPRVSIIVPCHNGGRFLDSLLASLGAQTFRDFETIIVDDGSTEAATREKLKALDPAIRVVHQENRYLPGARNRGFLEARAELVLPLDCDDTL